MFRSGLTISQAKYARDLLAKANMPELSKINTPITLEAIELSDESEPVYPTEYQALSNISHALDQTLHIRSILCANCQHFQNPTKKDLCAVKHILRYIKGTLTHGLRYLSHLL